MGQANGAAMNPDMQKARRKVRLKGGPLDGRVIDAKETCELGFPFNHIRLKIKEPCPVGEDGETHARREAILHYHYTEHQNAHVFQRKEYPE